MKLKFLLYPYVANVRYDAANTLKCDGSFMLSEDS